MLLARGVLLKIALYLVAIGNPATGGRERHKSGPIAIIRCLSLFFSITMIISLVRATRTSNYSEANRNASAIPANGLHLQPWRQ